MIRDEPGVMRVDSRVADDEARLADAESRPTGDDCRTTGDESRITGDDCSRRGDADTRELSPRDTLDGAARCTPDEAGARDGPESLGVARGADGGGPPEERAGAEGADADPPPPPDACPGDIRARCWADTVDARSAIARTEIRARMSLYQSNSTAIPGASISGQFCSK
jgi:hypothetical protein